MWNKLPYNVTGAISFMSFNVDVYQQIFEAHTDPTNYKFSELARKIYEAFSDEIVEEMNEQLQEEIVVKNNMSKDRKIFIR